MISEGRNSVEDLLVEIDFKTVIAAAFWIRVPGACLTRETRK